MTGVQTCALPICVSNQREFEEKQKASAARAADLEQRRKDAPKRAQENKAGTQLD